MTDWPIDILPLIDRLAQEKPIAQGLLVGKHKTTPHWPGTWQSIALHELATLAFTQRYDLAVIALYHSYYEGNLAANNPALPINQPDSIAGSKNQQLLVQGITRLRDLLARRVLVLASPDFGATLHALGFSQIEQLSQDLVIWQFNILSYKQVPDWLNSKYWANPENWNKYRW
ncbi:DUF6231 family protein [Alkanindiges illinoisensis]|uniref:DUF6231 family protein n=1 Tax=Alkanindiges illinoisensis TaxID=197183 RepID=UPI00047ACC45|nr:DUF6231 family protein [Alkanindiges illinoisensis]